VVGKRRRREWDIRVTRMDAERLVKILMDNTVYLLEDSQDVRKEDGAT